MDFSQLEAFITVCQTLNFTTAAKHLHISQSAITARIRALETTIGYRLFDRDNRTVKLTKSGITFFPYAERMLQLLHESKLSMSEQYLENIVVSGPGFLWHYRYLNAIVSFKHNNPQYAVKFLSYIDPGYMIRDLLLDGTVSLAIKVDPAEHTGISKHLLFEDEIILVATNNTIEYTNDIFSSPNYCHFDWGKSFSEWFNRSVNSSYIPALQTDHSSILLSLLLNHDFFGFLPKSIAEPYLQARSLHRISLSDEVPTIKAYACYLTDKIGQPQVKMALSILGLVS